MIVDSIDVHKLMKEFFILRGSRTLRSGRFSFITMQLVCTMFLVIIFSF